MPKNNRVKKEVKAYNLRLEPAEYEKLRQNANDNGIPMNTLIQAIVAEYNSRNEKLTNKEQSIFDKIKSLPLEERKAILEKLSRGE
ncbi:hypothetical protein Ga0466249_002204 [Sporomusaceae bacterium BoRhaA]|uniref:hypothetical protein n=1 Tax=Pelorhabdus rhamnosifermentans TaxID=2772457 RepID=UPI001C061A6C|nr:hypothetical protein [Pelorhabdus rhamnosifermentans]MBU2701093.1 hypothetical protein [Pelorhabdus rhamnosifermentans]